MDFERLYTNNTLKISKMSSLATKIVRDYYDPIIGEEQNTYMLNKFQTKESIIQQINNGARYYFLKNNTENIGFMSFYPRLDSMYLSKWYLLKTARNQGFGKECLKFLIQEVRKENLKAIELNVNRFNPTQHIYEHLGFKRIREEKIDVGSGFFMDDFVYRLEV